MFRQRIVAPRFLPNSPPLIYISRLLVGIHLVQWLQSWHSCTGRRTGRSAPLPEQQHGTGYERCQCGACGAAICCSRHINWSPS